MSIFFWYKNAALIEKQHPMVAGFFRFKDRKARRAGYAVESIPVHFWKRAKEIAAAADHMGEVPQRDGRGLAANRKKSETEERWLEQIQKTQSDIWQALRIGEIQKLYNSAKETACPNGPAPYSSRWKIFLRGSFIIAAISIAS